MESLTFDLSQGGVRALNQHLHGPAADLTGESITVLNPDGAHNIAVGANAALKIAIAGHAGYYAAGMNQLAEVTIHGSAGTGVAENMMSGKVHVKGFASNSAGASAQGGLLVIEGDAGLRCGISLKGGDIVVHGSVGHMSAFMAQTGRIVVLGDAGDALGDSLYEARIYVRGAVKGLGADCVEKEMTPAHAERVARLLDRAREDGADPGEFRRYGSARNLYHFHVDNADEY